MDAPASCFEAGSGNGSLLLALREYWKGTALAGVEPAPGAAAAARRAGLDVTTGFLEEADARQPRAALALSINVIEHTPDPRAFLRALASHGDRVAVVCPDGSVPNSELLFGDHLHSFHAEHLAAFAHAEGLRVDAIERAPATTRIFSNDFGKSHDDRFTRAGAAPARRRTASVPFVLAFASTSALIARINGARVAAFGAGEAAGLLRAYAPQAWSQVAMCAVDAPDIEHFGDLAVVDARTLEPGPILLAVRPGVQQALGERLAARGHIGSYVGTTSSHARGPHALPESQPRVIPFNKASFVGNEQTYIAEAIANRHISGDGPFTKSAQAFLEQTMAAPHVLLTTSCTHALEMAALLLDLQPGDEVVVPAFTFVSTVNAFALRRAIPVFVDIRPDTLNIDERLIEAAITPKTKAIVVVHYAGVACEMEVITDIARRHGLVLIEDNAHGLYATYRGKQLGTFGPLATQSFHETKNFTCGEGGALVVNDERYIERAEIVREKGTNRARFFRGASRQIHMGRSRDRVTFQATCSPHFYWHSSSIATQIQTASRTHLDSVRRRLGDWAAAHGVALPQVPSDREQSFHMFYMLLPTLAERTRFIAELHGRASTPSFTTHHFIAPRRHAGWVRVARSGDRERKRPARATRRSTIASARGSDHRHRCRSQLDSIGARMKKAIIIGTTDFAQVAPYPICVMTANSTVEAFAVNQQYFMKPHLLGLPVVPLEQITQSHPPSEYAAFVGIGYQQGQYHPARALRSNRNRSDYELPTYIHSTVHRWPETSFGEGCFIFENNVVQPWVSHRQRLRALER